MKDNISDSVQCAPAGADLTPKLQSDMSQSQAFQMVAEPPCTSMQAAFFDSFKKGHNI